MRWLQKRAFPLVKADYEGFWMKSRWDASTGLNHPSDDLDLERPERHTNDDEKKLGVTYRDVRAAAESAEDFSQAFVGEASQVAGVLLNSLLYKTERDLEWMAHMLGLSTDESAFRSAAGRRQATIDKYLWNPDIGRYENYLLRTGKRIPIQVADTFAPLFVGVASDAQAQAVRKGLPTLERAGGLMSTELTASADQWDGNNGWAPHQVMAIQGLTNYHRGTGVDPDARRLAEK